MMMKIANQCESECRQKGGKPPLDKIKRDILRSQPKNPEDCCAQVDFVDRWGGGSVPRFAKEFNKFVQCGVLKTDNRRVSIMLSYLETQVFDAKLSDHKLCFSLLVNIVGILCLGTDAAVQHVDKLKRLLRMHAELFNLLYPLAAKPKFHHLLHLTEKMEFGEKAL